jgi:fucose 4-O-acetylase-like acetyltransferase
MTKERNLYLDILKSITIILVIVGHCIQYGSGMDYLIYGGFFYNKVYVFIYSFHMPLFMLISGYLFYSSCKDKTWTSLLFKKFKQLIITLFCWSFITLIVQIIKILAGASNQVFSFIWIFQTILSGFWGGPWFLWSLWWCSFIIIIGRKFFKDSPILYILICLISFIVPDVNNSAVYKFMWPFFLIAYLFNKYDLKTKLQKVYLHKAFGISCIIIFVILLNFYNFNSYIYTTGYYVFNAYPLLQLHNDIFRLTIGLVGSLSIMCIVHAFMDLIPNVITKALSYIGKCTLGIYLVSNYLFDEVLKIIPFNGINFWFILLEFICVLSISIAITALLKRFKITNRLFLGGR